MENLLDVAVAAAKEAGDFIHKSSQNLSNLKVEQKSLHDYVSEVDRGAESIIRRHISDAFPDHSILGEEYGASTHTSSDYQWVIDPLDGTTNFLRGIPHYAVSIAVLIKGQIKVGVVYDPAKGDLFTAVDGLGALLNGESIRATNLPSVTGSLLATGVPFSGELLEKVNMFTDAMVSLLNQQTSGVRRLGAAALDLAYVAAGRYDGFWEANLKPWDIAAGILLVKEAGGRVSDFTGQQQYLQSGHVIAAGSGMFEQMSDLVAAAYDGW